MFDFTLPYQINERRNLTFQLIFITVGMIAEVGVGDDLRAAAAGRTAQGAVRRMRTRIGFLAQPEPMRSIVGATQ